jgi:hypothetical protein
MRPAVRSWLILAGTYPVGRYLLKLRQTYNSGNLARLLSVSELGLFKRYKGNSKNYEH